MYICQFIPQRAVPKAFDKQMSNIQAKVITVYYFIMAIVI